MIDKRQETIDWLHKQPDGIYKCQEIKESRSQAQNRLYHQWLRDIVWQFEERGDIIPKDDLHEWLRDKLIESEYYTNTLTWEEKVKDKSTTKLNKKQFNKYIEDIERYLWQNFQVSHPLPTDMWYTKKLPNLPVKEL